MSISEDKCYLCKKALEEDEGEEFTPYQLPDYGDYPVRVCSDCEESEEHQENVEQTSINHTAQQEYEEYLDQSREDYLDQN